MFRSVPEWEIFLKAILGRFPRLEMKDKDKLSCWSHHPFVIMQVLRKLILAKKDRSPAVQNFFLSWRNTQASRRVHLRQLWFCISANSLFLIEQVCIPIAAVWPQSKVEQTQVVTISILTTVMRMAMVYNDNHDDAKTTMTLIFMMIKGEIKSPCPEWKVKQKSTITCWQIRHLRFLLTL